MKTIQVTASSEYSVKIGSGLLHTLGAELSGICKVGTAAIISDSNVWPLYGEAAKASLESAGYRVINIVFPAGEQSKNGETYLSVLNYLVDCHITRSDCIVALGGGVVGDLSGFVAATFLRGIPYIQVPTTLLAAVDSSVGGKTAIDLTAGKNLAGAFYQPRLVLCDTDLLTTLPEDIFRAGCAEVIKYGVLFDNCLFDTLLRDGLSFDRETVIARCVELKRDVVAKDEFDTGHRQLLNLGHTVGHAVEALSDFTVSHGEAVAVGMAVITAAAVKYGICGSDVLQQVRSILAKFRLPGATQYSAQALMAHILSDKKRLGNSIMLVVPEAIGSCRLRPTSIDELKDFIEAGL
ncbi:MAG: 3-dehydroquinate synthase [Oscillospiraceae bacterium]|nr:3-dehydroquinate synthase [Oscillospiraceae bacterium]